MKEIRRDNAGVFAKDCLDLLHAESEGGKWAWVSLNRIKKLFTKLNKQQQGDGKATKGSDGEQQRTSRDDDDDDDDAPLSDVSVLEEWRRGEPPSLLEAFATKFFSASDNLRHMREQTWGTLDAEPLGPEYDLQKSIANLMMQFDSGSIPGSFFALQVHITYNGIIASRMATVADVLLG